jgi:lipopolysaccharide transport system ATP-binding protein
LGAGEEKPGRGQVAAAADHEADSLWALRDVSFDVRRGEVVAFIGRNGAGKSTLLKILSRITAPTAGRAVLRGRVGSLLEVGTGFHPELTGRENIYLNGAILGMSRAEIDRKFDEIVDFSGVEKFIDTPVKRYSTGMGVRLGFAVAAHLEPEVLIVDEVLAVGDAEFQTKCLGKMGSVARGGRTVLFVSHNMAAVRTLCSRALLLEEGRAVRDGPAADVVQQYSGKTASRLVEQSWDDPRTAAGNDWIRLQQVRVVPEDGRKPTEIALDTPLRIECRFWNLKPGVRLNLSLVLYGADNVCAFNTGTGEEPHWHGRPFPAGLFRCVCRVPGNLLNDGAYRVTLMFVKDTSSAVCVLEDLLVFDVHDERPIGQWFGKHPGVVRPHLEWTTELLDEISPAGADPSPEARKVA